MDKVRKNGKQGRWVWMRSGNCMWEAVWMGVDEVRSGNVGSSVGA